MNPNRSTINRVNKLLGLYERHSQIVIGVDFDHMLVDSDNNYKLHSDIVPILKEAQRLKLVLCLWTANPEEDVIKARWAEAGLKIDYYNESPLGTGTIKPHFNLLLDDCAGLGQALEILVEFMKQLKDN